jgi:hypothetical protein
MTERNIINDLFIFIESVARTLSWQVVGHLIKNELGKIWKETVVA